MKDPKVAVVIPAKNAEKTLEKAFVSVLNQKTEEQIGPYELHDFFIYYFLRFGFAPSRIARMALHAFKEKYNLYCFLTDV